MYRRFDSSSATIVYVPPNAGSSLGQIILYDSVPIPCQGWYRGPMIIPATDLGGDTLLLTPEELKESLVRQAEPASAENGAR